MFLNVRIKLKSMIDFQMAEARLAQLQQYDSEQIAVVLQQKLVQAEQIQKQEQESQPTSTPTVAVSASEPTASTTVSSSSESILQTSITSVPPSSSSSSSVSSSSSAEAAAALDPSTSANPRPSLVIPSTSVPPTPSGKQTTKTPQARADLFAMNEDDEVYCRECFDVRYASSLIFLTIAH
jgi:hypothetical protein